MSVNPNTFGINVDQEFQSGITDDNGVFHNLGDGLWLTYYPAKRHRRMYTYLIKKVGIRRFRVAAGDIGPDTNNGFWRDRFHTHLHTCRLLFELGKEFDIPIHVEFGSVPKFGIKMSEYGNWLDRVNADAFAFQGLVNEYAGYGATGVWIIGNENEYAPSGGNNVREIITSMTRVSNVVTFVLPTKHYMQTGDAVVYYNSGVHGNNGSGSTMGIASNSGFSSVTVIDDYTFTVPSTGTDGTSTIGWIQYQAKTVRRHMKRKTTELKGQGFTIPVSYSCIQGAEGGSFTYWISNFASSEGRGDIDYLDLNMYNGLGFSNKNASLTDFIKEVKDGFDRVTPGHFRVTEWHNAPDQSQLDSDPQYVTYWLMQRLNYMAKFGIPHFFFCWVRSGDNLAARRPYNTDVNVSYRDYWWALTNQRPLTVETSSTVVKSVEELRHQFLTYERASSKIHWNYGQDTQGGTFNTSLIDSDLDLMISLGHDKVRTGGASMGTSGITTQRQLVQAEKAKNMWVSYVGAAPNGTLTDANWQVFHDFVVAEAGNAVAYGVDEYCIGNELEIWQTSNHTVTNIIDKILALYDAIHALYPTLQMSYAMMQSQLEYAGAPIGETPNGWISRAAEVISRTHLKLGYNLYADNNLTPAQATSQFETRLTDLFNAYGPSKLYISEGVLGTGPQRPASEDDQGIEIRRRVNFALELGIEDIFLFTWRWDTASTFNQAWPIRVGSSFKGWFPYIYDAEELDRETGIAGDRLELDTPRPTVS